MRFRWRSGFATLARLVPRLRAILAVSAHWYVDGVILTGNAAPRTIHDFYRFPRELYQISDPAAGQPSLA